MKGTLCFFSLPSTPSISLKKTPHVLGGDDVDKPCYGVWMRKGPAGREGAIVYYTSDTIFRRDIGVLFPAADIIFHDCTFTPVYPGTVHTHYSELLTLPADLRGDIVLMHHTKVPEGIFPVRDDGFKGVARRHSRYRVFPMNKLSVFHPGGSGPIPHGG